MAVLTYSKNLLYVQAGCPFYRGFLRIATRVLDSDMIFPVIVDIFYNFLS